MISAAEAPLCLPPAAETRLPRTALPAGTVDTHFHVFRAGAPLNTPRSYTPQIATIDDWQALATKLNIARGVLVQPSVYGFDNSVLISALTTAPDDLRGIVVLPLETAQDELLRLDRLGVRGIRVNTRNKGGIDFGAVPDLASRMADIGWMLQFQVRPEQLEQLARIAAALPCPIVIDHLGFIPLGTPETAGHFANLQRLLDGGRCHVKLSAAYRLDRGPNFDEFGALVGRLAASHPDQLLWGSDWPHTELWDAMPEDGHLIDLMHDWLGNPAIGQKAFVTNPESLFFNR
jgi:predicted TIM-barrel fold metal-dependent hydrolase